MAAVGISSATLARLRANAARAGIELSEAELAAIERHPYAANVDLFERLLAGQPSAQLPDHQKHWAPATAATAGSEAGQAAAGPVDGGPGARSGDDDPLEPLAPLHLVAAALAARQISPVELTERLLERLAALDARLNAYQVVLADEARAAAAAAETEIMAGRWRGPFHGVPVAVKDLLDLAGQPTTAGSRIMAGRVAEEDAWAVARLKQAGAIIVGKTRMSEFAYCPSSLNAHYGPTRNPWSLAHDTGGSSSGSAAAVAAGLAYLALGSDTGCSIRTPSALCGLVGLKPTHGRISLAGAVTLSWSFDHLGPMVRSVRDAALGLDLLAGADAADQRTRAGTALTSAAGLEALAELRGRRIGVIREDGSALAAPEPAALAAWESGLTALRAAGATLIDLRVPELEALRLAGNPIINLEALTFHEPWLRQRRQDYGEFPRYRLLIGYGYGPIAYLQAQQVRARLRAQLSALWQQVDLLSTPALDYGAPPLTEIGSNTRYMLPFNSLGWPALVVPTGQTDDGRPLATQLIAPPWQEAGLLGAGRAIERAGLWSGRRPAGLS